MEFHSHIIKTFESAHTRRTDGDSLSTMGNEFVDSLLVDTYIFGVHLVSLDFLTFHGFECSRTNMQCEFLALNTMSIDVGEHLVGEMQSGCWSSNRSFDFRIDSLISRLVALLRFAVEIWRYRQFAGNIKNLGKRYFVIIPLEIHPMTCALLMQTLYRETNRLTVDLKGATQFAFFPFL